MTKQISAHYGLWQCDVSIASLFQSVTQPQYPFTYRNQLYWLQAQPEYRGRLGLFSQIDGNRRVCLTDTDHDLRTQVHVYGGRCHCLQYGNIIYNNFAQGVLYKQSLAEAVTPALTIGSSVIENIVGYADLVAIPNSVFILSVAETTRHNDENQNALWLLNTAVDSVPVVIADNADFYANPVVSADGKKIAWLEWDHPYMPWDRTRLVTADLEIIENCVNVTNRQVVVDHEECAVCQLGFINNDSLLFVSDSQQCDFWNFFTVVGNQIKQVTHQNIEFGEPHWNFGQSRWQEIGNNQIVAIASDKSQDAIVQINIDCGTVMTLNDGYADCRHVFVDENKVLFVAGKANHFASIEQMTFDGQQRRCVYDNPQTLFDSISDAEFIEFPTADNEVAYGYFYPPNNARYSPVSDTRAPLIIMIHGGPTGKCSREFSALKQYFCALGFAVFDLNHRGSSGYGRQFRQQLIGGWGVVDNQDVFYAIKYLVEQQRVDEDKIFIRGSSAGGYAVLRALTQFPSHFAAGASYYGIGNLMTLNEVTHKFESRYTDCLIGESFVSGMGENPDQYRDSAYVSRSPVFDIDKMTCPIILFQGGQDEVVPPSVAHEVIALLKEKKIKHAYWEYETESHGFRSVDVKQDALQKEVDFFVEILKSAYSIK